MISAPKVVWAYAWVEPLPMGENVVRASGRGCMESTVSEQKDRGRSVTVSHVEKFISVDEIGFTADWFWKEADQLRAEAAAMKDGDPNKARNLARAAAFSDASTRVNDLMKVQR